MSDPDFNYFRAERAEPYQARAQAWCMPNLRELCYAVDRESSRKASKLAIPQLLNEINVLRQPQEAEQRFMFMVSDPDLF